MTDWDLLTPGIGLTSIGITGVGISLSGIAKTFIDGMHAVSLLTMFIGMIFLASGLFKDGFPSSGRAKSATLITLGFLVTFGVAAAVTVSTQVPSIFAYIGLMTIIGIPAAVLAFVSFRKPQYLKAMAVIFISAAAVSGITFYAFGLVSPKPPAEEAPAPAAGGNATAPAQQPAAPANIVKASILAGASSQENPDFEPDPVVVAKGDGIEWTNNDNTLHTVTQKTAAASDKPLFDSGVIKAGATFLLNTATLDEGDYQYICTLHPFMTGSISIKPAGAAPAAQVEGNQTSSGNVTSAPGETPGSSNSNSSSSNNNNTAGATVTAVSIVAGSSSPTNGQFFEPQDVKTTVGSMVTWTNDDTTFHTVTSGKVEGSTPTPDKVFDSSIIKSKGTFSYVFEKAGEYDYYCSLHPYMTGKVTVN
ncbi:MAG: plastocyanin/azurin family copper-binding protein [Nitrososphaera sp.]|jgi:plastocyanin